jgi:hypothetical protein
MLCATVLVAACSSSPSEDPMHADADPSVPAANTPTAGCEELTIWPDQRDDSRVIHTKKTWDPARRILTAEDSSSTGKGTLAWRYAAEGRIIAYIGVEQPFQQDYRYDEHDNAIDFRLTYPDKPDLATPSTASVWVGFRWANEYGPDGTLTASTMTSSGGGAGNAPAARLTFTPDSAGRCQRIESSDSRGTGVEIRGYDDAGRLSSIDVTSPDASSHETKTYDEKGRLRSSTLTLNTGPFPGTRTIVHTLLPDGSERVETNDGLTDVQSEQHQIVTRTAACLAIDAAIGAPPDARCRIP